MIAFDFLLVFYSDLGHNSQQEEQQRGEEEEKEEEEEEKRSGVFIELLSLYKRLEITVKNRKMPAEIN